MGKVLVTGASGNVGSYVIKELLKMGNQVVAADIDKERLESMFGSKVDSDFFDFTKSDTFKNALENVDRIFLMKTPSHEDPQNLYPFIDPVKRREVKLITFLSLMGVENNTIPPHHKIEKYIEKL